MDSISNDNECKYLLFLDLETSGLDFKNDKIIEIGACFVKYSYKTNLYKLESKFNSIININEQLPSKIIELTNISQEELDNGEKKIKVQEDWANWLESLIKDQEIYIIGHSVGDFDLKFIKNEGFYLPEKYKVIDTNVFAKLVLPLEGAQNLEYLSGYFNVQYDLDDSSITHHRALYDTYINYKVFIHLVDEFAKSPISSKLKKRIQQHTLHNLPLDSFYNSWELAINEDKNAKLNIRLKKFYNYEKKYPQDQYRFVTYFKSLINNKSKTLEEFFDYYFKTINPSNTLTGGLLLVQTIFEKVRFGDSVDFYNLPINPYIQSKLYLLMYGFCGSIQEPRTEKNLILEDIINQYDFITSNVIDLGYVYDILYILSQISKDINYGDLYNQFILFKSEFEKNANYGLIYLNPQVLNNDLRYSLFEQSYFNFVDRLLESIKSLKVTEDLVYTNLKNELNNYTSSVNFRLLPMFKVNGGFINLFFPNQLDVIDLYKNSNIFSYLGDSNSSRFLSMLGIRGVGEINHIKSNLNNIEILDPRDGIDEAIKEIERNNDDRFVVVLNSYKIYKELENKVKSFDKSNELMDKEIFICGSMGSFTKGYSKLKSKKVDGLFVHLKHYRLLAKKGVDIDRIYFVGNTALNYSPVWPFMKNFAEIRRLLLESYILRSNDKKNI